MALINRQSVSFRVIDDQSPSLWGNYVGNWTHYNVQGGFNNNTITATPNTGATLSVAFSGTRAWLYGGVLNNTDNDGDMFTIGYPAATYLVDGVSAGSQTPYIDTTGAVVYFQTPNLADGDHTINLTVTTANNTNLFIVDFFLITPSSGDTSGVETTRAAPSATSSVPVTVTHSVPVGAIVGGIVGGIAVIAILSILAYYFLRRRSGGGRAYYFGETGAADVLSGEDNVEPFNTATSPPPSSAGYRTGPQSAYSDSSSQPLNPNMRQTAGSSRPSQYTQSAPSEAGLTYATQPLTGKAALIAQQQQNLQEPTLHQDSGIRFDDEQEPGPSQLPTDVPPTYTPN